MVPGRPFGVPATEVAKWLAGRMQQDFIPSRKRSCKDRRVKQTRCEVAQVVLDTGPQFREAILCRDSALGLRLLLLLCVLLALPVDVVEPADGGLLVEYVHSNRIGKVSRDPT